MSHLYDTIEPNVVSEALLRDCVAALGPEGEAGRIAKEEGTDFADVTRLRLDFQSMRAHAAGRGFIAVQCACMVSSLSPHTMCACVDLLHMQTSSTLIICGSLLGFATFSLTTTLLRR